MQPSIPTGSPPAQQLVNVSWGVHDTVTASLPSHGCVAASAEVILAEPVHFMVYAEFQVPDGMEEKRNQSSTTEQGITFMASPRLFTEVWLTEF